MNGLLASILSLIILQKTTSVSSLELSPLSEVNYSLQDRYGNEFVNDVFADNILLTLAYMRGDVKSKEDIDWDKVRQPFSYSFRMEPGEVFAFHDGVAPEYEGKVTRTTNAHFNWDQGFKSDGYLVGDGVCHLASFMNVVARQAGLEVVAPTAHDFAKIEDVAKEDGVSIYYDPTNMTNSARQNLYITNNTDKVIIWNIEYKDGSLDIRIAKDE